jgi:hypothetical protein
MNEHLINAVRETARERYNTSYGWSMIEECFDDKEILTEITESDLKTVEEVIAHFNLIAILHSERYDEVRAEIF